MSEKLVFTIAVEKDQLNPALVEAGNNAKKTEKAISSLSDVLESASGRIGRLKASFVGNLGADAVDRAITILSNTFGKVIRDSREFSRAIAEINSVLPESSSLTKNQTTALANLSQQFGTSASAQAKGFFESVSNGIEDTATAFNILRSANNAALSGLVDINTATRLITSTFNAYSGGGVSAAQVTDTLVAVTQASGVKFEELAASMGRVTNVAAQSGVSIGELGGTIAFLNQRSLTSEQAITGLAGILNDISKPTEGASQEALRLGLNFNVAALKAKGLVPFLQEVTDKTNGNVASLRRLFGDQRSANAVVAIATSEFSKYADVVNKVTNSQGEASRAAKGIKESLDFRLDVASNALNSLFVAIGEKLTPAIRIATSAFIGLRTAITGTPKSVDENRNKLQELAEEYNKNAIAVDGLRKQVIAYRALGGGANEVITQQQLNNLLEKQNQILEQRRILRSPKKEEEKDKVKTDPETDDSTLAAEEQLARDILAIQQQSEIEAKQFKVQSRIESITADQIANEEDLKALIDFENQKIDVVRRAELERNAAIFKGRQLELANQKTNAKANLTIQQNNAKGELALNKQKQSQNLSDQQAFFNAATTLSSSNNKSLAAIGKAAAIAQIAIQTPPAVAASFRFGANTGGPPLGFAFAAIAATAMAAQAAKVAGVQFEQGGFVGGANGASVGPDNTQATIRTGEMILNGEDQLVLLNALKSGSFGGGDIVVQVDGYEIARAVRNQTKQGFRL